MDTAPGDKVVVTYFSLNLIHKYYSYFINNTDSKIFVLTKNKEILGFVCYKADGIFRGRKYSAWFTTDLPNTIFPYKFIGLPGTILELFDDEGLISIKATKLILSSHFKFSPNFPRSF